MTVESQAQVGWFAKYFSWLDSDHNAEQGLARRHAAVQKQLESPEPKKFDIPRLAPFLFLHLGCLGVIWVGFSPFAAIAAIALYIVRMFFLTATYHRYFSHRAFSMNRFWQFIFALCTMTCVQRGPLWWASNHRHHHKHSDEPVDLHSPVQDGFWWSHIGWMTDESNMYTDYSQIPDLVKFPELVFLNRFDWLGPVLYGIGLYLSGMALEQYAPQLHTNGPQMLVWGLFVSTVILFHFTCTVNSLLHIWGSRRYETTDTSRNNFWLALPTLGEGWHNNHHRYQGTARQGFYWWEVDITYYVLVVLSWFGIVYDLHPVPAQAYVEAKEQKAVQKAARLNPAPSTLV